MLLIFSYSIGTSYELFLNRRKLFFKYSFYNIVGLQINNDKLLSWILPKGYQSPFSNRKYLFIIYYAHDCAKCCQGQREYTFLVPREFWVVREAEYKSIKSKTRQKVPNQELQIQSQILCDINSQGGKISGMVGSSFREEGSTWPELVRLMVFVWLNERKTDSSGHRQ